MDQPEKKLDAPRVIEVKIVEEMKAAEKVNGPVSFNVGTHEKAIARHR